MRLLHLWIGLLVAASAWAGPLQWKGSREDLKERPGFCQLPHASGTAVKISGTIARVDPIEALRKPGTCVHFLIQTQEDVIEVHVGLHEKLQREHISFAPGDVVEVEGSRLPKRAGNRVVVLAKKIVRDGKTIVIEGR